MPSTSRDPTCRDCGGTVGARATHCMHCGAEFDEPAGTGEETDDSGESLLTRLRPGRTSEATTDAIRADRGVHEADRKLDARAADQSRDGAAGDRTGSAERDAASDSGSVKSNRRRASETSTMSGVVAGLIATRPAFSLGVGVGLLGALALPLAYAVSMSVPGTIAALVAVTAIAAAVGWRDSVLDRLPRIAIAYFVFLLFVPTAARGVLRGGGFEFGVAAILFAVPLLFGVEEIRKA